MRGHVNITERTRAQHRQRAEAEGYLTRHKVGGRNFYEVHPDRPLRMPTQSAANIGDILRVVLDHARRDTDPGA